jgi:hypothetical protein
LRQTPPRTPQRAALAEAIAQHAALTGSIGKTNAAVELAQETCWRAMDKLKIAEERREQAQTTECQRLAALHLGETSDLPPLAVAEAAVTQASNDLQVARSTRAALAQRVDAEHVATAQAKGAVDAAVAAVVRSEVAPLVAECDAIHRRSADLSRIFSALVPLGCAPSQWGVALAASEGTDFACILPGRRWDLQL